jgi:hypothetical protein
VILNLDDARFYFDSGQRLQRNIHCTTYNGRASVVIHMYSFIRNETPTQAAYCVGVNLQLNQSAIFASGQSIA